MLHCFCPVDTAALLEDLLETSAVLYHKHVALIQKVFTDQWFQDLHEQIGRDQLEAPDAPPALVEACARKRLAHVRVALHRRQAELIRQKKAERAARDQAIHAYVESLHASPQTSAAA
jgi:hypothetical protein